MRLDRRGLAPFPCWCGDEHSSDAVDVGRVLGRGSDGRLVALRTSPSATRRSCPGDPAVHADRKSRRTQLRAPVGVACGAMLDRIERITPAYRGVMIASTPGVVWWGRLRVTGLELLPLEGPLLVVGDHDSYWDTVATGIAALARRQIRALAKSSMWTNKLLGAVLTGMGQIPIERGSGDSGALDRAIEELRKGACIGIYPEGTRSLGRALRARGGVGYLARAVPEARIVGVACNGTVAIPRFPRARPRVRVEFFEFDRPAIAPEESPQQYSTRLLAQLRQRAPIEVAGRKRAAALVGRVPTWSPELAITGRPGGKGALEEALAQTAEKHG
jgi:1-acyl-sn-glycerol-3-phosphate acyltransferase